MKNFKIYTDSGADIPEEKLATWDVGAVSLSYHFEGDAREYKSGDMTADEFYSRIKSGSVARTAAVSASDFYSAFKSELDSGRDILYIGLSSGISSTFNSARVARERLLPQYRERRILLLDSLSASLGLGLLVYLTVRKKATGACIDECYTYAEKMKGSICHCFTVGDLKYLKRGGRISAAEAMLGNLLSIKPILHMSDEGKLEKQYTVKGRRGAIEALADEYGKHSEIKNSKDVFISEGSCLSDAEQLSRILGERYGACVRLIGDIGAVIGAHSGEGTLALFFIGNAR